MPLDKLNELKEQRAGKIAEMRQISDKAVAESRELSGEERKRFDTLEGEVDSLNTRLRDAEKLAEFERLEAPGETVHGDAVTRRSLDDYSQSKALTESQAGALTGLEAEWHQELSRDREVRGVMVPVEIILTSETRALTTGTSAANIVATNLAAMTDRRRPALKVELLGATVLSGQTGNLALPRQAGSGGAFWVSEHTDATRTDATFTKKEHETENCDRRS